MDAGSIPAASTIFYFRVNIHIEMSTKTSKPKAISTNGTAPKSGKPANGVALKTAKSKKSMYEKWIEKYGIDDSKEAKLLMRAWNKTYENRHKRID